MPSVEADGIADLIHTYIMKQAEIRLIDATPHVKWGPRLIDHSGQTFGRLSVIEPIQVTDEKTGVRRVVWKCKCSCGNIAHVRGPFLRRGHTISCGCFAKDAARNRVLTHGMRGTRVYSIWSGIISRCESMRNDPNHARYAGRGITMCDRWRSSFQHFYDDMGDPPSQLHSIDRRDNDKGYFPDNCRWATAKEQARNRRSNRPVTIDGRTLLIVEWSEVSGIHQGLIRSRLEDGWEPREAVFRNSKIQQSSDPSF